MPVVADCEIMCWPFLEHALLIWVCLVVYKKPTILPHPHYHLPIPHLQKAAPPPFKSRFCCGRGRLERGRQGLQALIYARWCRGVGADRRPRTRRFQMHRIHFLEFLSSTCSRMLGCTYKDVPGHGICGDKSQLTNTLTI